MATKLTLEEYSHGARLSNYSRETFDLLARFLEQLALKEPVRDPRSGRMNMELKKRFYGLTDDRREAFIHRHHIKDLFLFLRDVGISEQLIDHQQIPTPVALPAEFELVDGFEPRTYQIPIVDTLSNSAHTNALTLQTGKGKTACALMAVARLGLRTCIMVPPKYFGIWEKALKETYKNIEQRYCTVSGSDELKGAIDTALNGDLNYDIVLISSATYRAYLNAYEKFRDGISKFGYAVPPPRFHEALGIGVQINDEFQDDPGLVFRTDIYTNVRKQIYLSATPYTGNDYVTRMIGVMLPTHLECPLPAYDSYINAIALMYSDPGITRGDYLTPFKNTYNHARYETRMLKKKRRLERYFVMVKRIVTGLFVKDREPGQKMLILCATVEFIRVLTKFLNVHFPQLQIGMHVSGSDYRKLMTNDITVSTIKSAGTGVDIRNLRETLLLQATDSKKDNIQILGRTRPLKDWPDVTPRFTYMVCNDIPAHIKYHRNKQQHLQGRVLNQRTMRI